MRKQQNSVAKSAKSSEPSQHQRETSRISKKEAGGTRQNSARPAKISRKRTKSAETSPDLKKEDVLSGQKSARQAKVEAMPPSLGILGGGKNRRLAARWF